MFYLSVYNNNHWISFPSLISLIFMGKWYVTCVYKSKFTLEGTALFHLLSIFSPDVEASKIVLRLWHSLEIKKKIFTKCFGKSKIKLCTLSTNRSEVCFVFKKSMHNMHFNEVNGSMKF